MGALIREGDTDPALQRGRVYGFLRRVFSHEVDEPLLAWCREQDRLGLWASLDIELGEILEAKDTTVQELAVDFCQLMVTSGSAGTPHESVHVGAPRKKGGSALLWGDPASAMKDLYREAGFELEEEARQLPDALTVELEFMERLCEAESEARRTGRRREAERLHQLQRQMLDEHLAKWVPDYGRRLRPRAATGFYRAMLGLVADFVTWDAQAV